MKAFFVAFLALAVSASALPQEFEMENREQRNAVERQIRELIEGVSKSVVENGWDPLEVRSYAIETSPQPGVDMRLQIENLRFTGASGIDILFLEWSTLRSRLRLTVALPAITFSLGESGFEVNFQGQKYVSEFSGVFQLTGLTLSFDVTINMGIISGISVRSLDATMRFTRMMSNINMLVNDNDYSDQMNHFFNVRAPTWLLVHQRDIDRVLSEALKELADRLMSL